MEKANEAAADNMKCYKTYKEIRDSIKEYFETKGQRLTKDELERTVRAYIYLTDDRIPVCAAITRKHAE